MQSDICGFDLDLAGIHGSWCRLLHWNAETVDFCFFRRTGGISHWDSGLSHYWMQLLFCGAVPDDACVFSGHWTDIYQCVDFADAADPVPDTDFLAVFIDGRWLYLDRISRIGKHCRRAGSDSVLPPVSTMELTRYFAELEMLWHGGGGIRNGAEKSWGAMAQQWKLC